MMNILSAIENSDTTLDEAIHHFFQEIVKDLSVTLTSVLDLINDSGYTLRKLIKQYVFKQNVHQQLIPKYVESRKEKSGVIKERSNSTKVEKRKNYDESCVEIKSLGIKKDQNSDEYPIGVGHEVDDNMVDIVPIQEGDNVEKGQQCPHCFKTFSARCNMLVHVRSVHNKIKRFSCQWCDFDFAQKIHLIKHVERKHPNET